MLIHYVYKDIFFLFPGMNFQKDHIWFSSFLYSNFFGYYYPNYLKCILDHKF